MREDRGRSGVWVRATLGLWNNGVEWRIAHEHNSVPFDSESGRALLEIKP